MKPAAELKLEIMPEEEQHKKSFRHAEDRGIKIDTDYKNDKKNPWIGLFDRRRKLR